MHLRHKSLTAIGAILVLVNAPVHSQGLSSAYRSVSHTASGNPPIIEVPDGDAEMNAAINKARATVSTFIKELKHPRPGDTLFSIKVKVSDPGKKYAEHIWLTHLTFDGTQFHGIVSHGDGPETIKSVKEGQKLSAKPNQISDWAYSANGRLVGGYSLGVLYRRASKGEQEEIRNGLGLTDHELRSR